MSQSLLSQLCQHTLAVTPYLKGYEHLPANQNIIYAHHVNQNDILIQQLYCELQLHAPEAGSAYWLTRTWDLLCWQPIYLAFISIYKMGVLPEVNNIRQCIQPQLISGFYLDPESFQHGNHERLIKSAGQQLQTLFEAYRREMDKWVRIRPGFTRHIFADAVLNCLLRLQKSNLNLNREQFVEQAKLWLDACQLSHKHLSSLKLNSHNDQWQLVRTSCCLVYKCEGRKMCSDCPRLRHEENLIPLIECL